MDIKKWLSRAYKIDLQIAIVYGVIEVVGNIYDNKELLEGLK